MRGWLKVLAILAFPFTAAYVIYFLYTFICSQPKHNPDIQYSSSSIKEGCIGEPQSGGDRCSEHLKIITLQHTEEDIKM